MFARVTAQKAEASSTAGRAAGSGTSFLPERLKTVPEPPRFATARAPQTFAPPPGGGEPLGEPLRSQMEASFGHDFSAVRVHQSERAARWGAVAVAQGDHLHFAPGRYQPATAAGRQVIGHELAHVVQQRAGRVPVQTAGLPVNRDPALESEAHREGGRAAAGHAAHVPGAAGSPRPPGGVVLQMLTDEEFWELFYMDESERQVRYLQLSPTDQEEFNLRLAQVLAMEAEPVLTPPVTIAPPPSFAVGPPSSVTRKRKTTGEEEAQKRPIGFKPLKAEKPEGEKEVNKRLRLPLTTNPLKAEVSEEEEEHETPSFLAGKKVRREESFGGSGLAAEQEQEQVVEDPWEIAAPGKQFRDSEYSFESIQKTVTDLDPGREERDPTFKAWKEAAAWTPESLFVKFTESRHLAALKKKAGVTWEVLDSQTRTQVATLFGWLIPLQNETITKIDNKKILMKQMTSAIEELLGQGGVPKDALIRKKAPITILNHEAGKAYSLGVESEVITGKLGALKSGELAEGRGLESDLNQKFQLGGAHPRRFIAGHLVAGSLGGKFQDWNLTPLTNLFNTTGENDGIKDAETEGLGLINRSRVIHYKTTVTYGNREDVQWWKAVLPTRLVVEVSTRRLKLGGTPSDIRDWSVPDPPHRYDLKPMKSVRWL